MTFVQLEYIVAVDTWRHFSTAAEKCFVTQPTLSMQIQKLEEEMGVRIFDRSKQPVLPTEAGIEIIAHARKILMEKEGMREIIEARKGELRGELRLAIIPTLAPFLIPLFIPDFYKKYPNVKLAVHELMTEYIVRYLREGRLDAAILATPLNESGLKEYPLFYEEFVVFTSPVHEIFGRERLQVSEIDSSQLWLMKEGHCFRSQVLNFCELNKNCESPLPFEYEAGSVETLLRLVELQQGITVLPELATVFMPENQRNMVRRFTDPIPMREVSLVVSRDFVKQRLLQAVKDTLIAALPLKIKENKSEKIVPI